MTQTSGIRSELIERLGRFAPQLEGRVYPSDFMEVRAAYDILSKNPSDEFSLIQNYVRHLRGVLESGKLYARNADSRSHLTTAIEMLEDILNS